VINYHPTEAAAAAIDLGGLRLRGPVRATELNGEDTHTPTSFERPHVTGLRSTEVGLPLEAYAFPPHSATILEMALER
jgi:hypothetical protein